MEHLDSSDQLAVNRLVEAARNGNENEVDKELQLGTPIDGRDVIEVGEQSPN